MKGKGLLRAIALSLVIGCSNTPKGITLSVEDVLKKGDYIGNIDESKTYKFSIGEKGKNIALQMINYQTGEIYSDLSSLDSLEFKETFSSVNGMNIYNVSRIVRKE